ncbi:MAG: hypothetical protein AB1847_00060 [bacterium]
MAEILTTRPPVSRAAKVKAKGRILKVLFIFFLSLTLWSVLPSDPCLCLPVTIIRQVISPGILAARKKENDRIPELPTFRAPILQEKRKIIPVADVPYNSRLSRARQCVIQNLAESGILKTLIEVMRKVPNLPYLQNGRANKELLEEIGLPVRLLSCFFCDDPPVAGLDQVVAALERQALSKNQRSLKSPKWKFNYVPSLPGFKLMPENGVCRIEALRMQLYPLEYIKGPGDGCITDIVRQMLLCTSREKFLISVSPEELTPLTGLLQEWNVPRPERIILLEDESVSSQWAQDNCKTGVLYNHWGRGREYITLVPRFASAGEDYSEYRPAESFVFDQVQRAGWRVVQSPLLFQGGNVLPVKNPKTGELTVFAGQAELVRNIRLGLKEDEVQEALAREWGADRIEILPPLSFHIDLEVSFRWHRGRMIAFINDSMAAARLIVKCGIQGLFSCSVLTESEARKLTFWLEHAEQEDRLLQILWHKVNEFRDEEGQFASNKDDFFVISAEESGRTNLSRFLLGLDLLSAAHREKEKFWAKLADQDAREDLFDYYRLLLEREEQRDQLKKRLLSLGIEVIPLPSTSDDDVSLNYLNAVHDLDAIYLPALGGMFQEMDRKVLEMVKGSIGNSVKIHLIRNSSTQSQCGGVHCSVSVYGR